MELDSGGREGERRDAREAAGERERENRGEARKEERPGPLFLIAQRPRQSRIDFTQWIALLKNCLIATTMAHLTTMYYTYSIKLGHCAEGNVLLNGLCD